MKRTKIISLIVSIFLALTSMFLIACDGEEKEVKEIKLSDGLIKSVYQVGEMVDYSKMKVTVVYGNGEEVEFKFDDEVITSYTPIDTTSAGEKEFKIVAFGKEIKKTYKVEAVLESISIKPSTLKAEYAVDEEVDYDSIVIIAEYNDETTKELALSDEGVVVEQEIDTTTSGTKTLTVSFGGKTASAEVTVLEAQVNSIEVISGLKEEYKVGETLNADEITLKVINQDLTEDTIKLSDEGVSYTVNLEKQGDNKLSITYKGKNIQVTVKVVAVLESINFSEESLTLGYGDEVDYESITINAVYNDASANKTIRLSDENVIIETEIDTLVYGEQTLKVSYFGFKAEIEVLVKEVLVSINFALDTTTEYYVGSEIDYSNIYIDVVYNDETLNKTLAITDEKVEITNEINTNEEGKQILTVSYEGKTASITIDVLEILEIDEFSIPQAYSDYLDKSDGSTPNSDTEFAVGRSLSNPYKVGSINKFEFVPITKYTDWDLGTVTIENPRTIFKLWLIDVSNGEENASYTLIDNSATYVEAENNMYKFNDDAVGKLFKMEIYLDPVAYDYAYGNVSDVKVTIDYIKVEKAYNVYDTYGLSVMDNLNVKNWAEIKNGRKLKWDDKFLNEYTDVELVILHKDIVIDADLLPSNYFWSENMTGYEVALSNARASDTSTNNVTNFADRLKGSLRDGVGGETYNHTDGAVGLEEGKDQNVYGGVDYNESWDCENVQKGLFNTNQCSISGNFKSISTKDSATRHFTTVIGQDYEDDIQNPAGHWSIFKLYKTNKQAQESATVNLTIENVFVKGNMAKTNKSWQEAGLMFANTFIDTLDVNNVITTQFYTHIVADGNPDRGECALNFTNSRMTDAYSNMIYLWRSKVNVVNSILKNAGGPLFIMCDADRTDVMEDDTHGPVLNIDDKSVLESWAAGTEAWYQIWGAQALFGQLQGMGTLLKYHPGIGKGILHNVNGAEQINLIAVIIPNPGSIMGPAQEDVGKINIYGKVVRNNAEEFSMNNPFAQAIKSSGSVLFTSGNQYAYMDSESSVALLNTNPYASQAPSDFSKSSDWLSITMSAAAKAGYPYFSAIIGNFSSSSVEQIPQQ